MIGMALMADSVGFHVPKGYIYSAMLFSIFIEAMNMLYRRRAGPLNPTGYPPRRRRSCSSARRRRIGGGR